MVKLDKNAHQIIGVLGCGFVGEQVLSQFNWHQNSWFTRTKSSDEGIEFNIDDTNTWQNLPEKADCLLVTFPPAFKTCEDEAARLRAWCSWMNKSRPAIKRLIYISTTGVYAEQPGHFDEYSPTKPSHLRGELRLCSEQVLAEFFDLVTIRCGGIYGPKRNIISKIKSGKAIFAGHKKVYRIHVEDLANMVALIAKTWPEHKVFHGVDSISASQDEVIAWLKTQSLWDELALSFKLNDKRLDDDSNAAPRTIGQNNLLKCFGYQLKYPSFKEGLKS